MSASQRTPSKLFIQMSGAPGSGKSTVARLLRPSIGGAVIDHDVLRSSLIQSDIIPFYKAAKQAYILQWSIAQDFMRQGLSVVVDSPCNFPEVVERGSALARQHSYVYWYIECKVKDVDILDQRLRTRHEPMVSQRTAVDRPPAAARDSCTSENSQTLFAKWIDSPCRPTDHVIVVDGQSRDAPRPDLGADLRLQVRQDAGCKMPI